MIRVKGTVPLANVSATSQEGKKGGPPEARAWFAVCHCVT